MAKGDPIKVGYQYRLANWRHKAGIDRSLLDQAAANKDRFEVIKDKGEYTCITHDLKSQRFLIKFLEGPLKDKEFPAHHHPGRMDLSDATVDQGTPGPNLQFSPEHFTPDQEGQQVNQPNSPQFSVATVKTKAGIVGQVFLGLEIVYETAPFLDDVDDEDRVTKMASVKAAEAAHEVLVAKVEGLFSS